MLIPYPKIWRENGPSELIWNYSVPSRSYLKINHFCRLADSVNYRIEISRNTETQETMLLPSITLSECLDGGSKSLSRLTGKWKNQRSNFNTAALPSSISMSSVSGQSNPKTLQPSKIWCTIMLNE